MTPSRRRLRSRLRRSSDLRSDSCSGGYRYSLMPARSEDRIASASAVVLSAMIIGSPAAARIDATSPSSGSFQPLMSTRTTSGRIRSRRSRKLLTSPISWCSTMMRNGRSASVACAWSHSSRFSIASPMVNGYMKGSPGYLPDPPPVPVPPPVLGVSPGFSEGGVGCTGTSWSVWWAAAPPGLPCAAAASSSTGIVSDDGCTGTGPVLSMPG